MRIDPKLASFYRLPSEVPFQFEDPVEHGRARAVLLPVLAAYLSAHRRDSGEPLPADLERFLRNWPHIEKLERFLAVANYTFARTVAQELERLDPDLPCALYGKG